MARHQTTMDLALKASLVSDKLKKQMSDMTDMWAGMMAKANKSVFTVKQIRGLEKASKDYEKAMMAAVIQVANAEQRLRKDRNDEEAKAIIKSGKDRIKQLKSETQSRVLAESIVADKRQELADKFTRNFGEELDRTMFSPQKAEAFGDSIAEAFSEATAADFKSWAALVKRLGQTSGRMGARAEVAGVGKEGGGKALGNLGKVLGGVGKAMIAIAGVAVAIAAIVKVILDADSAAKELNRTLFDSGVAGMDLADSFGEVTDAINDTRTAFSKAVAFNYKWGTTAKDNLEIIGAYANAGLVFYEIAKGAETSAERTEELQKATEHALVYSKLLGKSTTEVAEESAARMEDFGLTLKGVAQQFNTIISYAKESGFATKRFYGMILQATSGMSMYNIRVAEASELLVQLGKVLGQDLASTYLESLTKGFKDESTQDRIIRVMRTGIELTLDILRKGAIKSAEDFQSALRGFAEDNGEKGKLAAKDVWDAIGKGIGMKGSEAEKLSPKELMKRMQKMSGTQRGQMLAEAGAAAGDDKELKNQVESMVRQLSGLTGKAQAFGKGRGAAQAAMEYAGPAEALALKLNALQEMFGKRIDQIKMTNEEERMAWESITGESGEVARQLFEIGQKYSGINASIEEAVKTGKIDEWNTKYSKQYGVELGPNGERKNLKGGVIGGGVNDLILAAGDAIDETLGATLTQDQQTALEIADNTRDMAHIQEVAVAALLEEINGAVQWIAGWLEGGLFGGSKEARAQAQDAISKEIESSRLAMKSKRQEKSDLARELRTNQNLSPEERAMKTTQLQMLEQEITQMEGRHSRLRETRQAVRGAKGGTAEEVRLSAERSTVGAALERMSPEQRASVEASAKSAYDAYEAKRQRVRDQNASMPMFEGKAVSQEEVPIFRSMEDFLAEEVNASLGITKQMKDSDKKLGTDIKTGTGKTTEAVKGLTSFFEAERAASIMEQSGLFAGQNIPAIATAWVNGGSMAGLTPDQIKALESQVGHLRAHDMVMQFGEGGRVKFAQRVDNADTMSLSKKGGALSKGGGLGGTTNVFHLYNDGHGVMRTIEKAQKAGLLRG